ncbi:MAG: hypothetical protein ABIQ06_09195, partial [Caldimonas sp.]
MASSRVQTRDRLDRFFVSTSFIAHLLRSTRMLAISEPVLRTRHPPKRAVATGRAALQRGMFAANFARTKARANCGAVVRFVLRCRGVDVDRKFLLLAGCLRRLRRRAAWMVAAALLAAISTPALAQWQPNETLASPQSDLIDYEFSQSRGMFAWNDCCGSLWLGKVNRATGRFDPPNGKFMLVDPDSMTYQDAQKTKNGPEWVSTLIGDVIVYTRYSGYHTDGNSRIGYAFPMQVTNSCNYISADAYWCASDLGPAVARKAPYGSHTPGDPAPRISYVDNREVHYWRELWNPASEQKIPDFPDSNYPIRQTECAASGVPGARSAVYPVTVGGIDQVFMRDFDSGVVTQLTADAGQKYEVWMWCAPEFGNELVFFTLVDQVELRVYRNLPVGPGGAFQWSPVFSQFAPTGNQIFSPEPFVY